MSWVSLNLTFPCSILPVLCRCTPSPIENGKARENTLITHEWNLTRSHTGNTSTTEEERCERAARKDSDEKRKRSFPSRGADVLFEVYVHPNLLPCRCCLLLPSLHGSRDLIDLLHLLPVFLSFFLHTLQSFSVLCQSPSVSTFPDEDSIFSNEEAPLLSLSSKAVFLAFSPARSAPRENKLEASLFFRPSP